MKPLNATIATSHHTVGSMAHPIGSSYTQYPGMKSPHEMFGGAWVKRFSNEGIFFRTEGSSAKGFNGGIQSDMVGPHNHPGPFSTPRNGSGRRERGTEYRHPNTLREINSISKTDGHETRPKNRTYCIWERVG